MKPSAPKKAILNFDSEGSELVSEVDYSYSRSIRNEVQIGERLPPVVSQTNLFSVDPETVSAQNDFITSSSPISC